MHAGPVASCKEAIYPWDSLIIVLQRPCFISISCMRHRDSWRNSRHSAHTRIPHAPCSESPIQILFLPDKTPLGPTQQTSKSSIHPPQTVQTPIPLLNDLVPGIPIPEPLPYFFSGFLSGNHKKEPEKRQGFWCRLTMETDHINTRLETL